MLVKLSNVVILTVATNYIYAISVVNNSKSTNNKQGFEAYPQTFDGNFRG
jgi:hypothetical protein